MDPAESWERLSNALLGPYERDIVEGLTGAYRALEGRIETAYKRAQEGGDVFPLRRLLILREQLGQELQTLRLPPELQLTVAKALLDGRQAGGLWGLAQLNSVQQQATAQSTEQVAELFASATANPEGILTPAMAQQNPSALLAAAQRQNALSGYAAGATGSQAFASLNRLVEVDLRGRIIGAVEFHLAQGDSWRQLSGTLKQSLALTSSRAQVIARTEMAAAMLEGTKIRYEAEGIQQVQWQAVGSSRTCGYCAPRHGRVYLLREVVIPAHPNCRCTVSPWDPRWLEVGLVDLQEEAKARAEVLAELKAAGKEPIDKPSPFEKALGLKAAPKPLWTPPPVESAATNKRLNKKNALSPAEQLDLVNQRLKKLDAQSPWKYDNLKKTNKQFAEYESEMLRISNLFAKQGFREPKLEARLDELEQLMDDMQIKAMQPYKKLKERRGYLQRQIDSLEQAAKIKEQAALIEKAKDFAPKLGKSVEGIIQANFSVANATAQAGLKTADITKAFESLMAQPGEAGKNARAMLQFVEKSGTTVHLTGKMTPAERWEVFMKSDQLKAAVLRQRTGQGADFIGAKLRKKIAGEKIHEHYESQIDKYIKRFMLPPADANGQAFKNYNFVSVKRGDLLKGQAFSAKDLADHVSKVLQKIENGEEVWSFSHADERAARSVMSTLIHEIGHVVQFMDETKDDKLGIRLRADKKLTTYSGTNDLEAFAEGFVAFVTQPATLKKMRPKLYDRIRRSLYEYLES